MSTTTLNLTQKGMLLIAVPLIFELGFAAALNYQLKQAERNVQSEIRARETIACANTITRLQVDAGTTLIAYKATGSSVLRKRLDALIEQVPEEFERFKEQAAADPQIVVLVNSTTLSHCKTALTRLLSALKSIENTEVDPSAPGAVVQFNHQIFSVQPPIKELVAELNVLVDQVQKQQYASSARAKHSRQLALLMLSVGLLFNIAITVVLAVFYTRGITTRLSVLLENTKRFARSQELSAPLEDADEIGELDRVFHDMAKAAQQAEQLKGEFISIVSHDLQAPLTSIRGLLKILPERLHNAADERTMKLIETAHDETGRLISLTNDLLDLAKMESGRFSLKLQPTDLKTVISRSVQSVEMLLHNRKIEIAYAPEAKCLLTESDSYR
jgi:signal transduction histidine kinase